MGGTNTCESQIRLALGECGNDPEDPTRLYTTCSLGAQIVPLSSGLALLTAGVGSVLGGALADKQGRRGILLRMHLALVVVFVLLSASPIWQVFILLRVISGGLVGAAAAVVPSYIS